MRIVIAGGTGFLGSPLAEVYAEEGHDVRVLTRSLPAGQTRHESGTGVPGITQVGWNPATADMLWASHLDGADAVVNLAGESIGDQRWTPQRKAALRDSRIVPTRTLVTAITTSKQPPRAFVSGSATGYYGSTGDAVITEESPAGEDFLAHIAIDWEGEARRAEPKTRVVRLRTGVVLERSGGALAKMLPPFRFFAGGPMGTGRQYMSWIHRRDWIEMVRWVIDTPSIAGAVNATAPIPVTNAEFADALGTAIHRPALLPVPAFALTLLLGEMAGPLILEGQRVVPKRAQQAGFHFRYPEIDRAFRGIFGE